MHELPKELGDGLRSFRNSVHRHSGQYEYDIDLEKGIDEETKRQSNETSSSLILVGEAVRAIHIEMQFKNDM